jgi:flagellar protein FliO/FliZ
MNPDVMRVIGAGMALLTVLGLVMLAGRLARRWGLGGGWTGPGRGRAGTGSQGRMLTAAESIALDPRRRLHLIRCGERQVLLLTGGSQDLVIGWLPSRESPP